MSSVKRAASGIEQSFRETIATCEVRFSLARCEAMAVLGSLPNAEQLRFGRSLCSAVIAGLWRERARSTGCDWPVRQAPVPALHGFTGLSKRLIEPLLPLSNATAGFLIGQLYPSRCIGQ